VVAGRSDESAIQQAIRLLSLGPIRLFRNNTGALKDQGGRLVRYGLCTGSSDLIGWRTITITPEMVGQRLAVFTSIEVKTPTGHLTPAQSAWLGTVRGCGGIAGIARSVRDAEDILR
jgi:hypothetical protein